MLTDQNHFTIVTYNPSTRSIDTEGHGLLEETNARITDQPITTILDAHSNTILVSAFTGFLFAVPLNRPDPKGKQKITSNTSCNLRVHSKYEPKAIRTNEFDFLSVVSLKGVRQQAAIAVLLGEINELKTIKTFKYYPGTNEITEETKLAVKVEATTHTLIAVPDPIGGVLAIGEYIISYHDLYGGSVKELSIDLVVVTASVSLLYQIPSFSFILKPSFFQHTGTHFLMTAMINVYWAIPKEIYIYSLLNLTI